MFIETTTFTFAIPTFLLSGLKFAAIVVSVWLLLVIVGVSIYMWSGK